MLRRYLLIVAVAMTLAISLKPVTAQAANEDLQCIYIPQTMVTVNCTAADLQMIEYKTRILMAAEMERWQDWHDLQAEARQFQTRNDLMEAWGLADHLNIRFDQPLSDYQALDVARVGPNIRYATAPNLDGGIMPRLLIWDQLGRPAKISGVSCTSAAGHYFDQAVAFALGTGLGTAGAEAAGLAWKIAIPKTALQVAGGGVTLTGAELMGVPDADSCNVLIDVLHTFPDGSQGVYRNRSIFYKDGTIRVQTKRWSDQLFWFLGYVGYDENGQPVW